MPSTIPIHLIIKRLLLVFVLSWFGAGQTASAATRYVPDNGTFNQVISATQTSDTVIVRTGSHLVTAGALLSGKTDVTIQGEPGSILYGGAPSGVSAILRLSSAKRVKIIGLTIEGAFQSVRGLRIESSCATITISNCEVRNFGHHGLDIDARDSTVSDSRFHHNLAFPGGVRTDAHGIVTLASTNLTIQRCRSYCNSGDSFQAGRGKWTNVTISDCDFWDEPIPAITVNSIFGTTFPNPTLPVGMTASENAIDTKHDSTSRGVLNLVDLRMSGFRMTNYPTFNASALVIKEYVKVNANRCLVKDSKIGWRVRAWDGGLEAQLDQINCWTENCDTGFRLEDAPSTSAQTIRLTHNTFKNCSSVAVMAPSTSGFFGNSSVTNSLVEGSSLPSQFLATNGNRSVAGQKGIAVPTWSLPTASTDLLKATRPSTNPTAGAIETYP